MLHIHTILVPTDFSACAEQALTVARSLARDHNAKLVLAAVSPPPPPQSETFLPDTEYPGLIAGTRREVDSLAAKIVELPVEARVMAGAPGPSIVAMAEDCRADLIVMGTHGRTGITRFLMGSVAEHVLRHAKCPVLTIKTGAGQHLSRDEETALAASRPTSLTTP